MEMMSLTQHSSISFGMSGLIIGRLEKEVVAPTQSNEGPKGSRCGCLLTCEVQVRRDKGGVDETADHRSNTCRHVLTLGVGGVG